METLRDQLGIPLKYMSLVNDRICITVHRNWLANLLSTGPVTFVLHEHLSLEEVAAQPTLEELGLNWLRIYVKVYHKQHRNAIPLPRARNMGNGKNDTELTFAQLLHYVIETNHHNLWKEAYKKYYSRWNPADQREQTNITASSSDVAVIKDIIMRMYACPMVQLDDGIVTNVMPGTNQQPHCNLLSALLTIETMSSFVIIYEQTAKFSLQECVTYSPAAISSSHSKPLFVVYQLLKLLRDMHDRGLALGEVTLSDILITENFTIEILPDITYNVHLEPQSSESMVSTKGQKCNNYAAHDNGTESKSTTESNRPGTPSFGINENIDKLCELWIQGRISNFDYLTALNNIAGRRYGDPCCHHVMPWVTDFTSRCGGNWRDLTKSKFRLNKGDRQLDLTFDSHTSEVGHHVSDVLSEITYYVYLSRRYTRSVLCKHVRPSWVPWEYPASIQRLHHWSPDECIPQFFTDPNVFKSIHEDLPDLEIPPWATSPEDFIDKHREALESLYVSERLHHWIDLTFGYKLSGTAAVKSKNVCLQLVDNHTALTNSGIVQLFSLPHPQKLVPSPYWSKIPPRLHRATLRERMKNDRFGEKISEDEGHSSGFEEDDGFASNPSRSSPLGLSRLLSRSRSSLVSTDETPKNEKTPTQILLPKDYNPISALVQVETTYSFLNKITHQTYKPGTASHDVATNYKQIVALSRIKEQQILGCLIVEIFLSARLRVTGKAARKSFTERFNACVNLLKASPEALPRCVRNAVTLLLQVDVIPRSYNFESIEPNDSTFNSNNQQFRYLTVTNIGLPPPSAHQLLQPIFSGSLFPFPKYFQRLFGIVEMLQEYDSLVQSLNLVTYSTKDNEAMSLTRTRYLCKISECKVKAIARNLELLFPDVGASSEAYLELIVPRVRQIMEEPYCAVLAAWYLFDPIAKVIGPKHSAAALLNQIVKLYENSSIMDTASQIDIFASTSPARNRTVRLYHRSFLLKLIVRLGLRRFLDNFITPLVEAVGGYRDHLQSPFSVNLCKAGNLKSCDLGGSCGDTETVLSPLDEDSSGDSDRNGSTGGTGHVLVEHKSSSLTESEIEEVFVLETEESSPSSNTNVPYNIDVYLELNLSSNDLSEEANKSSPPGSVKSPTIPIPKRVEGGKLIAGFNSIGCHVGSKTSNEDIPRSNSYVGTATADNTTCKILPVVDNFKILTSHSDDENPSEHDADEDTVQMSLPLQKLVPIDCKVSEMSAESVIWLSHRLGPVLTARYLSRNLLRMLTLCYAGADNLTPVFEDDTPVVEHENWSDTTLFGDQNAAKVIECLTAIAVLYGEQIILLQYLGHMVELIALCKRKLTLNLEGGLVSCLALLNHITVYLSDSALMDALHETILRSVLHPAIRILSTTRYTFPNGKIARSALANKYVAVIYSLGQRLGSEMSKTQMAVPIQRFFLTFGKIYGQTGESAYGEDIERKVVNSTRNEECSKRSCDDNQYWEVMHDGSTQEWAVNEVTSQTREVQNKVDAEISDSYSPPVVEACGSLDPQRNKVLEELKAVFTPELAHETYLAFYRYIGDKGMEEILKNHQLVRDLCYQYEQEIEPFSPHVVPLNLESTHTLGSENRDPGCFDNISVIGNRIEVHKHSPQQAQSANENASLNKEIPSNGRHLRGNWLAYWEHEIGRPDKDTRFNIKQIKLQTFAGHSNSVRCMYVLDNENSFMSGGRDKTVKLWSLRSQGDGSAISQCQYTYTGHKKSILALTFLESLRYAVTCDGSIHCWDPFMGSLLGTPECIRPAPVNTLAACPVPSTMLLAATTDITLRVIDCRTFQYVNEMKVSVNPTGVIRCIAVGPSGHWIAMGQASGFLTILDIRTGLIIASWKGHECEILQLEALNDTMIISSSLDQSVAVWSAIDGKLKFHLKGTTEPVHCLSVYEQELISGTTANRIGVHTSVEPTASFSSTKLRSDTFKGVLTAMAVLPLNRLLLLGADNGGISLLC